MRARPAASSSAEAAVDGVEVGRVGAGLERARVVVLDGGGEQAEGGEHAGRLGDDHLGHPHLLGEGGAVHGPGAAQDDQRELARIVAALDRHQADLVRHAGVDDAMDARRRRDRVEAQPAADGGDRALRGGHVEGQGAAGEARGVQVAEHDAGVGHGGLVAAARRSRRAPARRRRCAGPPASRRAASIHAMLPPPAPMVLTSTIGVRTG